MCFGIVILESWLAGTPVLVHDKSKVLKHHCMLSGGGLWFRTYPEFQEELYLLLSQPRLRNAMGASGRKYVQTHYNWSEITQKAINAIDRSARENGTDEV